MTQYIRNLGENLDAGRGLWLEGDVGTGKTSLAMLASHTAYEAGYTVAIYSAPRLLQEIRSTYDEHSTVSYATMVQRLVDVDVLHIDDLGSENQTGWALEQLYVIVDERYANRRPNIVSTNLTIKQLLSADLGSSSLSRVAEMEVRSLGKSTESFARSLERLKDSLNEEAVRNQIPMARIVSRLAQRCVHVPLFGDDHRNDPVNFEQSPVASSGESADATSAA